MSHPMEHTYETLIQKIKAGDVISAKDWQFIKSYENMKKSEEKTKK
jgi:hypothetical protein